MFLKYRNTHIFPLDLLDIGETLGKGAFGKVLCGILKLGPNLSVKVRYRYGYMCVSQANSAVNQTLQIDLVTTEADLCFLTKLKPRWQ